ncbi:hypothetical protein KLPMMM105M1_14315 [Klebsiella pneumoniae]
MALVDLIKPPAEGIVLGPFGQMQHDFHLLALAQVLLQASDSRVQQASQPVELSAALPPAFPFRPQDAAVDFVADLHHIRQHARLLKAGDGIAGIVMNRRFQLRVIQLFPGFRLELLAGIGPEIAVVKIKQQLHPLGFRPFRQRQGGGQIIVPTAIVLAARRLRIHPQTEADIVDAVLFQNSDRILALIILIVERRPVLFGVQQRGDIRAFDKVRRHALKRAGCKRVRGQRRGGETACQTNRKPCGCESFHVLIL